MSAQEVDVQYENLGAQGSGLSPIRWDHFGDPEAEKRALAESAAWMDARGYGSILLEGGNALKLLQGQITQDVGSWSPGDGGYAAFLDRKGRMITDLILSLQSSERVQILLPIENVPTLLKKWAPVAMLEDCSLSDTSGEGGRILAAGPQILSSLKAAGAPEGLQDLMPYQSMAVELGGLELRALSLPDWGLPAFLLESRRLDAPGLVKWFASQGQSSWVPVGAEAQEVLRIESGTARWGIDMAEENLAPECNIAHAISYTKGCYVGQETVARLRTYGQANKTLSGFVGSTILKVGTELFDENGKKSGWITSSTHSLRLKTPIALGYAKRGFGEVGQRHFPDPDQQDVFVEVAALPLVPREGASA